MCVTYVNHPSQVYECLKDHLVSYGCKIGNSTLNEDCDIQIFCTLPDVRYVYESLEYLYTGLEAVLKLSFSNRGGWYYCSDLDIFGPVGIHPHVSNVRSADKADKGMLCLEYIPFDQAVNSGNLRGAALLVATAAAQFNTSGWFRRPDQPVAICGHCKEIVEWGDYETLDDTYCLDCLTRCYFCEEYLLSPAGCGCGRAGCKEHFESCQICSAEVCECCVSICTTCDKATCPNCRSFCRACFREEICAQCMPGMICPACTKLAAKEIQIPF